MLLFKHYVKIYLKCFFIIVFFWVALIVNLQVLFAMSDIFSFPVKMQTRCLKELQGTRIPVGNIIGGNILEVVEPLLDGLINQRCKK